MKEFEKSGFILLILSMTANFSSYLFQMIMGRMLDIGSFGTLNSLISIYTIISIPVSVISITVSKYVSEYKASGTSTNDLLKKFLFYILLFALCFILIGFCFSGLISSFIKVNNFYLVFFVIIAAGFGITVSVITGGLQGEKKFYSLGIIILIFPLVKLFGSIFFVFLGFKLYGVFLSFLLGNVFSIITGTCLLKINFFNFIQKINLKENIKSLKFVWEAFLVNIGMTILLNIDVILVKHFFSDETTGFYSVASILGKIIIYISSSLVLVMFPYAAEAAARKDKTDKILMKTLFYGGGLSILYALVLNIFTKQVISILFGVKFLESSEWILPITLWIITVNFISILSNYFLAIDRAKLISYLLIIGCVIIFVLIYFFHNTIAQMVNILALASFTVMLICVIFLLKKTND